MTVPGGYWTGATWVWVTGDHHYACLRWLRLRTVPTAPGDFRKHSNSNLSRRVEKACPYDEPTPARPGQASRLTRICERDVLLAGTVGEWMRRTPMGISHGPLPYGAKHKRGDCPVGAAFDQSSVYAEALYRVPCACPNVCFKSSRRTVRTPTSPYPRDPWNFPASPVQCRVNTRPTGVVAVLRPLRQRPAIS